jgi:hypothetical protein
VDKAGRDSLGRSSADWVAEPAASVDRVALEGREASAADREAAGA